MFRCSIAALAAILLGCSPSLVSPESSTPASSQPRAVRPPVLADHVNDLLGRLTALERPLSAFLRLDKPIEFDAADGQPVDLVFALIVPENSTDEHLQILAGIAALFSNPSFCSAVRDCSNDACLLELLTRRDGQQKTA